MNLELCINYKNDLFGGKILITLESLKRKSIILHTLTLANES